jgi:hypothetical protein
VDLVSDSWKDALATSRVGGGLCDDMKPLPINTDPSILKSQAGHVPWSERSRWEKGAWIEARPIMYHLEARYMLNPEKEMETVC